MFAVERVLFRRREQCVLPISGMNVRVEAGGKGKARGKDAMQSWSPPWSVANKDYFFSWVACGMKSRDLSYDPEILRTIFRPGFACYLES